MKKRTWDLYAPIYKRAMAADRHIYDFMYRRIPTRIADSEVLEIATGPGLLARHVAPSTRRMVATDYSDGMIAQARKGAPIPNLTFEVADAMNLPYPNDSFDAVLIANALHIIPDPEGALREIDRVLRPGGLLIAPNFVEHGATPASRVWSGILRLAGVRFEHQWTGREYLQFLEDHGWRVFFSRELSARIALMYAECTRKGDADANRATGPEEEV